MTKHLGRWWVWLACALLFVAVVVIQEKCR